MRDGFQVVLETGWKKDGQQAGRDGFQPQRVGHAAPEQQGFTSRQLLLHRPGPHAHPAAENQQQFVLALVDVNWQLGALLGQRFNDGVAAVHRLTGHQNPEAVGAQVEGGREVGHRISLEGASSGRIPGLGDGARILRMRDVGVTGLDSCP
ncbi:hypothetical protein [Deinococcus sp. Arct2-2]|uniref:hypothetical protein n=1 Tax=Deinococcus sp. Arct2-2 TaxID=2568653 RepID=UPI001F0D0F0D|nr:hypothetical protein [Deinococcus sp. Arct2-2]